MEKVVSQKARNITIFLTRISVLKQKKRSEKIGTFKYNNGIAVSFF